MKIVHVCLSGPFTDGWSYQDNLLPKYHSKQGNDVAIIASQSIWDEKGNIVVNNNTNYVNTDGVKVHRLPTYFGNVHSKLKKYKGLKKLLTEENPEVLFVHGSQYIDILTIVKYLKKNRDTEVYVDNHNDFSNSAKNWLSKNMLHKILWKFTSKEIEPYTMKFYGVLPARVDFLTNVYGLPKEKCELLVMGADDELINEEYLSNARNEKRKEYGLEEDIVLMTGGKIDHNKPQTISLMKVVNELDEENVKLLVFGSVIPELKDVFEAQLSEKVKYIGWKKSSELYGELAVADIVAFPGLHSVLWEQTVAMGKPCIFKKIDGFTHIDIGGNCLYFEEDSVDEYKKVIKEAISSLGDLKQNAAKEERKQFLYSNIARKSIGE